MISMMRQRQRRLAQGSLALFALFWFSLITAPCAMAHVDHGDGAPAKHHDCPHCPPKPCHQKAFEPVDCDQLDPVDRLRLLDGGQFLALLPAESVAIPTRRDFQSDRWFEYAVQARDGREDI
jgi:hypothetical protein